MILQQWAQIGIITEIPGLISDDLELLHYALTGGTKGRPNSPAVLLISKQGELFGYKATLMVMELVTFRHPACSVMLSWLGG